MLRILVPKQLIFAFVCGLFACTSVFAQEDVTFTYVGQDDFFFCLEDTTQTILIAPDANRVLTEISIEWILGVTDPIVITDPTNLTHTFTYPARRILDECNYAPGTTGLRFTTQVFATYDDSPNPENVSRTVTFRKPPQLTIMGGGIFCAGQTVELQGQLCPNNDPTQEDLIWTLPDGTEVRNENTIEFVPPTAGTYTFSLENTNECGTGRTSTSITVIDAPQAVAVADSNLTTASTDPYQVCIDEPTTIRLNGEASLGLDGVRWTVSPANGASIEDRFNPLTRVTFDRADTYRFILSGTNNSCEESVQDTFFVEVLATSLLQLNEQPDDCVTLDYQPSPFEPDAIYWLDNVLTDFSTPVTLGPGDYTVEGFLPSINPICVADTLRDTFSIVVEQVASIAFPDTTICDQADAFTLSATPTTGGIWMINNTAFNGSVNPGNLGGGTYRITYGNNPCVAEDEVTITILSSEGSGPSDEDLCLDSPARDYTTLVSPTGGDFFIDGVPFDGVFAPDARGLGDFAITYVFDGGSGTAVSCGNSIGFDVNVSELAANFETGDCDGDQVCFVIPAGVTFQTASWDFDGMGTGAGNNACFTFPGPGTYTITLTTTNGPCTATATEDIVIAPAPAPAFSLSDPDPLNCSELLVTIANNSATAAGISYDWQLNGVSFSDQQNPDPLALIAVTQDTTYTISLSISNACTTRTVVETIMVRPLPIATFGTNKDVYCSQEEIELANPAIGQTDATTWTLNGEVIGTDSMPPQLSYSTEIGDTIEVCLIAENECAADTLCRNLRIIPTDVSAFFNYSPSTVCVGDSLRITNFATQGVDVLYTLSDGRIFTESNPVISFTEPGVYTVSQRAIGCGFDEFEQTITVIESPVAAYDNPGFGCPGGPITFRSTSEGALGYSWDFGDGSPVNNTSETSHRFDTAGTYNVCLTVSTLTPDACDNTICQTMTIREAPQAAFTVTDSVCLNETTFVTSTSTASANITNFSFLFGDGNIAGTADAENVYPNSGPFTITHIVTDANQCSDTVLGSTFILPLPSPAFTIQTMDACDPEVVSFINTTPDADSYRWVFGDGESSTETSPMHSYLAPGTYEVSLQAFINGVCTATITQSITINEMPTAAIGVSETATCFGDAVVFTDNSTGPATDRRWDFGDGTFSFEEVASHEFPTPGRYTVQLWIGNDTLCSDSTTIDILVNPPVNAAINEPVNVLCNGESTGSLMVVTSSGTAPFSYDWSNGTNTPDNPGISAGTYTVNITDDNGCQEEISATITEPERIEADATVTTVTCAGDADGTLTIDATGGIGPYTINWEGGAAVGTLTGLVTGTYPITITDANDCEVEREVFVPENSVLSFTDEVVEISCFGAHDGVLELTDLSGGVPPYTVSLTGAGMNDSGVGITRFDSLGPGIYTLEIFDDVGCFLEQQFEWIEPALTMVNIIPDSLEIDLGQSVTLDTRFNASEPAFEWSPAEWLDCTDCPSPEARPCVSRTYGVLLTDQRGCTDRDEVYIRVNINRDAWLPNTFTPNGDGLNDVFRIRSEFTDAIETIESFRIYNSWDELVFEAVDFPPNDRSFGWDGSYKGERLAPNEFLYVAIVRYKDLERIKLVGSVSLIR